MSMPRGTKYLKWTDEEKAYLAEITQGRSHREVHALMNDRFDRFSLTQITAAIKRYGLNTGRTGRFSKGQEPPNKGKTWDEMGISKEAQERSRSTCFKPGIVPHNTREVGSERITKDGYTEVKTSVFRRTKANDCWELKHRLIWEEAHGSIPEGFIVCFANGDKSDFRLENLILRSMAQNAVLNHQGIKSIDRASAEAANTFADLSSAINKKACSERACHSCGQTFKPEQPRQRNCRVCIDRRKGAA